MLKSFKVESFKSLENVEVELGRVNVFIGANGSGKSNLLEALGVLGAAANGRVDDEALLRRGVRPGLPVLYKSSFKSGKQQTHGIRFSAANEGASFSVELFNPLENPEPTWRFESEILQEDGKKPINRESITKKFPLDPAAGYIALKAVELPKENHAGQLLNDLRQYAIYSPNTEILRGLISDPQSREPLGLSGGRLAEAILRVVLTNIFEPFFADRKEVHRSLLELIDWAHELYVGPSNTVPLSKSIPQSGLILRFQDRFMQGDRDFLSGYDVSEGALYVLFMTALVHHPHSPPLLSVDNFDHALNPRLAKALTKKVCEWIIARKNRQLLLTSHNPLVLDGLPLRNDDIRLFTVERSNKGKTVVTRVKVSEQLLEMADKGFPLSQQWVMGTFGGVPDI